jgi:hypothetical protein
MGQKENIFKRIFTWMGGVLQDETGTPSSKRVVGLLCGITLCITLYANSFSHGDIKPSDILVEAVTALAFGCLGLSSIDKIWGKKKTETAEEPAAE